MSENEQAMAFMKKLLEASTRQGEGKRAIDGEVVTKMVREDPESAAKIVLAVCRTDEVPTTFAQLAMAIAAIYKVELGDDSLINEVNVAPWVKRMPAPAFMPTQPDNSPREEEHPLLKTDSTSIRILEADPADLQTGSVQNFVRILGLKDKSPALVARMSELWGMCILVFPLDKDPRGLWEIPEARRFVANLHEAMPYFPAYLQFRQEFGMFMVYFGCLADPEAVDGGKLDLTHPSVTRPLSESLMAVGVMVTSLGKDVRPIWRTMLSPLPVSMADELIDTFYQQFRSMR